MGRQGTALRRLNNALFEAGALGYTVLTRAPAWRRQNRALVDLAALGPGQRVLDLGCGPGISAFAMLDRVPDLDVVGLDISRAMLFFAELWRGREPRGEQARFVHADARDLPFPDQSFDAVTGHSFLYLLPAPHQVLVEVRRVLRPGGRAVFLEPHQHAPDGLLPPEVLAQATADPRFVFAMALWRLVSRAHGRFDEARFAALFAGAGLSLLRCAPTLGGLGLYGIGERPRG